MNGSCCFRWEKEATKKGLREKRRWPTWWSVAAMSFILLLALVDAEGKCRIFLSYILQTANSRPNTDPECRVGV